MKHSTRRVPFLLLLVAFCLMAFAGPTTGAADWQQPGNPPHNDDWSGSPNGWGDGEPPGWSQNAVDWVMTAVYWVYLA